MASGCLRCTGLASAGREAGREPLLVRLRGQPLLWHTRWEGREGSGLSRSDRGCTQSPPPGQAQDDRPAAGLTHPDAPAGSGAWLTDGLVALQLGGHGTFSGKTLVCNGARAGRLPLLHALFRPRLPPFRPWRSVGSWRPSLLFIATE